MLRFRVSVVVVVRAFGEEKEKIGMDFLVFEARLEEDADF